jgi:uncharacterized membrane protein
LFSNFRRFFVRGLSALLPTLITLWVLIKVWDFLWENLGQYLVWVIKKTWLTFGEGFPPAGYINRYWSEDQFRTRLVGVSLAILAVYILGVFVGNFIGRALYRLGEMLVMRVPLVRAIYPAVKQVTDFLLAERSGQFQGSRVVACEPHAKGVWSIGLVTGAKGIKPLTDSVGREMATIFIPSSPTAFSGYVVILPREDIVELPMDVEEAMRLLISGGVLTPREYVEDAPLAPAPSAQAVREAIESRSAAKEPTPGVGNTLTSPPKAMGENRFAG